LTTLFKATFTGNSVLRAFNNQQIVVKKSFEIFHQDILTNQIGTAVRQYQNFKQSIVKSIVLVACFTFCMN